MSDPYFNKYRAAIDILQKGRDLLVNALAEEILDQGMDLIEGGYQFNEFLESQGTRLHFLSVLVGQLEQSAEVMDEAIITAPRQARMTSMRPPSANPATLKRSRAP